MKINIIPNEKETRVCLIGELDTTVTTTQVEDLNQVLALADKALEIDCEELEYISSSGLRIFLNIRKEAAAHGSKVIVRNINADIRQVFMMTGFISLFEII